MAGCFASKPTVGPPPYSGMVNCAHLPSMAELLRLNLDITQGTPSRYYLFLAPSLLIGRYVTWASDPSVTQALSNVLGNKSTAGL